MAFFNTHVPLRVELTYEDEQWETYLQNYIEEPVRGITKEYLINFFIKNFSKNTNQTKVTTRSFDYTRSDNYFNIVSSIHNCNTPNAILFYKKTSISRRMISTIKDEVNNFEDVHMTEQTGVSLYLQENITSPIRVFKVERPDETVQYVIIGTNNMLQNVYYTCLGLIPNWFPETLMNIDEDRKTALKELCNAIGNKNTEAYIQSIKKCFELCFEPVEQDIDFTSIVTLLDNNRTDKINHLNTRENALREQIDSIIIRYDSLTKDLRRTQWELSKLTTENNTEEDNKAIEIAKTFKSIVGYKLERGEHHITLRSKMMLESDAIVKKLLQPNNTYGQEHYYIYSDAQRRMFEDLFVNKTLELEFCTTIVKSKHLASPDRAITPIKTRRTANTMPNPHLVHYNCFGDNVKQLIAAQNDNNFEYYLGILTASNSNLNTGDATVLKKFCKNILEQYYDTRVLYDVEAKKYITPRERVTMYEAL